MKQFVVKVGDTDLEVVKIEAVPLVVPQKFIDNDPHVAKFIEIAVRFLRNCNENALTTPWMIASGRFDMFGAERTDSPDHMSGAAFDMSPMYSEFEALAPERQIMGLAWNIKSLISLSQAQDGTFNVWAEGDHLHFRTNGMSMPAGDMGVAWSESAWYPVKELDQDDPVIKALFPSLWWWRGTKLTLLPPPDSHEFTTRYLQAEEVESEAAASGPERTELTDEEVLSDAGDGVEDKEESQL